MVEGKNWWESKGVVGGIVAAAAGISAALGYAIAPNDVSAGTEDILSIVSAIGGLLAIYGRVTATTRIGRRVK